MKLWDRSLEQRFGGFFKIKVLPPHSSLDKETSSPPSSVLGPLLFIMYTMPPSYLFRKAEDIKHHLYAYDTQVHNSFNTSSFDNSKHKIRNSCSLEISVIGKTSCPFFPEISLAITSCQLHPLVILVSYLTKLLALSPILTR